MAKIIIADNLYHMIFKTLLKNYPNLKSDVTAEVTAVCAKVNYDMISSQAPAACFGEVKLDVQRNKFGPQLNNIKLYLTPSVKGLNHYNSSKGEDEKTIQSDFSEDVLLELSNCADHTTLVDAIKDLEDEKTIQSDFSEDILLELGNFADNATLVDIIEDLNHYNSSKGEDIPLGLSNYADHATLVDVIKDIYKEVAEDFRTSCPDYLGIYTALRWVTCFVENSMPLNSRPIPFTVGDKIKAIRINNAGELEVIDVVSKITPHDVFNYYSAAFRAEQDCEGEWMWVPRLNQKLNSKESYENSVYLNQSNTLN